MNSSSNPQRNSYIKNESVGLLLHAYPSVQAFALPIVQG